MNFLLIHDSLFITLNIALFWGTLHENSLGLGTTSAYGEMKVSTFKPQHQIDVKAHKGIMPYKSITGSLQYCWWLWGSLQKSISQFLQSKAWKEKYFTFSATFPSWQTLRSPASYQKGRTSKFCARHRNVWGSQEGGGGPGGLHVITCFLLTIDHMKHI